MELPNVVHPDFNVLLLCFFDDPQDYEQAKWCFDSHQIEWWAPFEEGPSIQESFVLQQNLAPYIM
jgi:hypothetical protein